jgi:hypothetical protein
MALFLIMAKIRRYLSSDSVQYIEILRVFYHPDKNFDEVLSLVIEQFEGTFELKKKLTESDILAG